jgi:preprotein translocase subunit YajC
VNGGFVILILVALLLMWMLLIRPQRRRQVSHQTMLDNLRIGDEVLTAGGFYGTVSRLQEDEVVVEVAPGVDVRVAKRAIAAVIPPDEPEEPEIAGEIEAENEDEPEALEADQQTRR